MAETSSLAPGATPTSAEPAIVDLAVPADGSYVATLRTLAAGLAARLDFTMDDVEDLRISVSEAAAMVLEQADEGARLECHFTLGEGLSISIETTAADPEPADYETFGWQVLATLAAEATIDSAPGHYAVRLTVRSSLTP